MGHKHKRRSLSSSPCRTGKQDNHRDENESSLQRDVLRQSGSQGCLRNARCIDLAASAPEHSLREMLVPRERRLYSVPQGNFLGVPQPSMGKNGHNKRLCSSHTDLSHCSQDLIWVSSDTPQKSKNGVFHTMKAIITHLGLSPRTSPCHSPESSRSASPISSRSASTLDSFPFSPPVEFLYK